jgi:sec-independent protein translocase protein TatB
MFDIGWSELFVIAVLAIVVIGPKDLPKVMRAVGRFVRKARHMAAEFREGFDQMVQEAELDEVKKSVHHVSNFNPKKAVQTSLDPAGTFLNPPIKADEKGGAKSKPSKIKPAGTKAAKAKPRAGSIKKPAAATADKVGPKK